MALINIEMELSGRGNGWTDVTADLMDDPIRLRYGINGGGPNDRVASTGSLSFALDNSSNNSAAKVGYYSPNHTNRRTGFKLGAGVRLIIRPYGKAKTITNVSVAAAAVITTATAHGLSTGDTVVIAGTSGITPAINGTYTATVLSTTTFSIPVTTTVGGAGGGTSTRQNDFYKFSGILDAIKPSVGVYSGDYAVRCTAVDWMNEAARQKVTGLATQTGKRSDELFSLLVAAAPNQPIATETQTGQDTYAYAFDNTRDETIAVMSEFQRLASSELGFIYVKGDRTNGGTLVFEARRARALASTNVATFLDATGLGRGIVAMSADQSRQDVLNKIQITTHPRRVDTVNTTVLCSLTTPTAIGANSSITLLFPYRDPLQRASRVGGTDMISPVSGTDYAMNTASDGSGTDITSLCTVTADFGGNGVRYTVMNTGGVNGYITLLQARGRGIYDFENVILEAADSDSATNYGEHVGNIDMPYQSDASVGSEAALYLVNLYKDPTTQVRSVSLFSPYSDVDFIDSLMRREISDRIGISETVTGISPGSAGSIIAAGYFVNAVDLTFDERGNLSASYTLAPADKTAYWQLEVAGRTELDFTTTLGFGQIVGHTDVAHVDSHGDVAHADVAHADVSHSDVAHADQSHGDTAHSDVVHSDQSHGDTHGDTSHGDTSHSDSHGDVAHNDSAHNDSAHSDVAHDDVAHVDNHSDFTFPPFTDGPFHDDGEHDDSHGDAAHADVSHGDTPHGDSHTDVAHSDSHGDISHSDGAHDDTHSDSAHSDTAHADVAHADGGHQDTGHSDVAHSDVLHSDVLHSDTHSDVAHGDI